jgi:hypothetical protein
MSGDLTDTVLAVLYLFVSVESVAIQLVSLARLRSRYRDAVHRHLLRTVRTRVIVMSAYVGLGMYNLLDRNNLSIVALSLYTAVALVWQFNSLADARLARERNGKDSHD